METTRDAEKARLLSEQQDPRKTTDRHAHAQPRTVLCLVTCRHRPNKMETVAAATAGSTLEDKDDERRKRRIRRPTEKQSAYENVECCRIGWSANDALVLAHPRRRASSFDGLATGADVAGLLKGAYTGGGRRSTINGPIVGAERRASRRSTSIPRPQRPDGYEAMVESGAVVFLKPPPIWLSQRHGSLRRSGENCQNGIRKKTRVSETGR